MDYARNHVFDVRYHTNVIVHPKCFNNSRPSQVQRTVLNKDKLLKRALLLFVVVLMSIVLTAFVRIYWLNYQLDLEIQALALQAEEYRQEQAALLQDIEMLKDPIFIERIAREKLGYVRTGEVVLIPAKPGEVLPLKKPIEGEIQH
ncbi:MAG: septum formation initiator family protein [Bacillota bacterium]